MAVNPLWAKEVAQINDIVSRWTEWTQPLVVLRDESNRLEAAYKAADEIYTPREWREIYSDDGGRKSDPRIVAREAARDAYFAVDQLLSDAKRENQERATPDIARVREIFRRYRGGDSEGASAFDATYQALSAPLGTYSRDFRGVGIWYEEK